MNAPETAPPDGFRILRPDLAPATQGSSAVFSSPHSGRDYPEDLLRASRLNAHDLRRSEDAFVEQLFDAAPEHGAPLIHALAPRAYVDLNRGPDEMDPALIAGMRAAGLNPRLAAGLGVIPRVVAEGVNIYLGKLTQETAQDRLRRCYRPYHAALQGLLDEARARTGCAVLIDCHSMPSDALRAAPRVRGRRPEIILGDRFGVSCAPWIMAECERAFGDLGFAVARNSPFAGGYITQKYGRPARGVHAVQVEIDRGLYLDEDRIVPGEGFEAVRAALRPVIARLAALRPEATALAAE